MKCLYLFDRDCHKVFGTESVSIINDCEKCENKLADSIIRKWCNDDARSEAMENDIIKAIKDYE
jgi:hypothetical protein